VNVDTLIGKLVRRLNQQILDLPPATDRIVLPPPVPGQNYLLYLHVPYCAVLCPFCSFHRVQFKEGPALQYFDSLRREIELATEAGYRFDEVYIGGGTPTVLPDELRQTIEMLRARHPVREVSVETNPDDLENESVAQLTCAGVNRLSVGVQSLDDRLLREMQRFEKYGSGELITQRLKNLNGNFETFNVDMIFNFPHQDEASIRRDLEVLTEDVGVDQVSWYPLMSAGSTRQTLEKEMGQVDYSREKRFYRVIAEHFLSRGYTRNSAWCFSRKAGMFDEYIVDREEYVGLGSGAFSYLQGSLYVSTFSLSEYRDRVAREQTGMVRRRAFSERDQMRYFMLMQLFGGSLERQRADERFGGKFSRSMWQELTALKAIGAIREAGGRLSLTERGYYLWVVLMREFFSGINRVRDQMKHVNGPGLPASVVDQATHSK